MKLKFCFLLFFCPIFTAYSQQKYTGNGLNIGDKVPDVLITGLSNYTVEGRPVSSLHLSRFAGKLLIIDFWATWCSPCRAMIPVMDSLQKAFKGRVQFLPVTYQTEAAIRPVVRAIKRNRNFDLPEVTGDKVLHALFPHRSLPHYVWIDGAGTVCAITEFQDVTAANIQTLLTTGRLQAAVKNDIRVDWDSSRPLFINGNGGDGTAVTYHTVLSGYVPGLKPGMQITPYDTIKGQFFSVRNTPFTWLCRLAYADHGRHFADSRIKILSRDSARLNSKLAGAAYESWLAAGNGWCYELLVPPSLNGNAFPMIRQDLQRMFPQYTVTVEEQPARCLALARTSSADKLRSAGGKTIVDITPYSCKLQNAHISQLMLRLDHQYLQNSPLPVIDASGYSGRIDMSFEGKLFSVASLNASLKKYDLAFVEQDARVEMLVIRDTPAIHAPAPAMP